MTTRIQNEIEHFTKLHHIWWGALTYAGQRRYDLKFDWFKKLCRPTKSKTILEVGCGDGEFTRRLISLDSRVIGTDITPSLIKKAKINFKHNRNIQFFVDDCESMRFKNNSFDVVCGISILHHVDLEKSLRECYRVLKKGGVIFFTEPNYINPQIFITLKSTWIKSRLEYSPDEVALVKWQVGKLMKKIGFKKIRVINFDFLYPLTPKWAVPTVERLSQFLENVPVIKEISGSLIIFGKK